MASEKNKKVINIPRSAAGQGVRKRFELEAKRRGKITRRYISDAISYACKYKERFITPLAEAQEKDGDLINLEIDEETKKVLKEWANEQGTTLSLWANHLLEKIIEMDIFDEIKKSVVI